MVSRSTNNDPFEPLRAFNADLSAEELNAIIRVSPEPLRQFTDLEVHQLLCADLPAYLNYIDLGLREISLGNSRLNMPPKQLFQQPGESGDFRVMPCVRTTSKGRLHKTVKLVGTNRAGQQVPDQISVGKACYLDPLENFVSHQFDACLLSSIRTGACAAVAARHLQSLDRPIRSFRLVGAGRVGFYAALCLLGDTEINSLQICDYLPPRAAAVATALQKRFPDCEITSTDYASLTNCDLLVLATSSETALYHPDQFDAQIVISLGADSQQQREIHDHPQWHSGNVYVDTVDSLLFGDLAAWRKTAEHPESKLTDITQLAAAEPGRAAHPALFIATGSALLDNLTMSYLVEITAETEPGEPLAQTRLETR